jgi:heptaprenyl diphosphate synthase
VRFWLIPHAGIAYLIPVFMTAALVFGVVNGLLTNYLLRISPAKFDEDKG